MVKPSTSTASTPTESFNYIWDATGPVWNAYDPYTAEWVYSMTNVPSGTRVFGPSGEILIYVTDYRQSLDGTLELNCMWTTSLQAHGRRRAASAVGAETFMD